MSNQRWALHWPVVLACTLGLGWLLQPVIATASVLVAAMACGMAAGCLDVRLRIAPRLTALAQALTGTAIASTLHLSELLEAASDGLVVLGVALTIGSAALVGWLLVRYSRLPGTTGAWGSLPGAASIMGALATDNGGDGILVSLMQYLRVVLVVVTGPLVAHAIVDAQPLAPAALTAATPLAGTPWQIGTLAAFGIAALGCWIGTRFRILAGAFLVPMALGAAWVTAVPVPVVVPAPLLAGCFAVLGWTIGLQFRRDLLRPLVASLPVMLAAIVAMMALCAAAAWLISATGDVSFLTAYLATSPGGVESIVAIALGTHADMNFVVATQTLRLFSVVVCGPWIARRIARGIGRDIAGTP
ncbi:AbrB family transcriptional regulator [Cupriavidus sp. H18C2]|uniref:AbrB family transcriptional regulator n=1 Tax=Cupriavidus sp. H18C2 TaxID=3241602 RepID=UPI003BF7C079